MPSLGGLVSRYTADRIRTGRWTAATAATGRPLLWQFARAMGVDKDARQVRPAQVERWMHEGHVGDATKRNRLSAVRNFYRWCIRQGYVRGDPTAPIEPPKQPRYLPRGLHAEQVRAALIEAPDLRGELIMLFMAQEALRAVEISRLQVGDVDRRERLLAVMGKGGRPRMVPVSDETWSVLRRYMAESSAGPLLRSQSQPHRGISARHVARLAGSYLKAAGISETGHALRHTAADHMLDRGAKLTEVRDALGHETIKSTEIYTSRAQLGRLREVMGGRRYGVGPESHDAEK